MLQIAICDDNINDLSDMAQLISLYRSSRNLSFEYAAFPNGFELISALEKGKRFDVYCLDILMPGFSGIEAAKEIRAFDKVAPILFLTTSPEYALESYSVKAINYILKPVSKEKLFAALDEVIDGLNAQKGEASVVVKSSGGIRKILVASLTYVEVVGRNVLYHLNSGKVIECTDSFSSVCDNLMKHRCFVKPHRSYLVNMQYIDTIDNRGITLQNLSLVPIAQGKAKEVKAEYLAYQMEEE